MVKFKEVVQTARRYSRISCHLLMGIVLKIEMVGSLNCTSVLKGMGMRPLLLCTYPKHGTASTSTRKFGTKYQVLIHVFPFHVKLQYKDLSCRPVHEHNFIIIISGCAKNLVLKKLFIDCQKHRSWWNIIF